MIKNIFILAIYFFCLGGAYSQELSSLLDVEVAQHQYHGEGAEDATGASSESTSVVKHEKLSPKDWLTKHLPQIFSQDYINHEIHGQLVEQDFNSSGLNDFKAWQTKQTALLVRHQYIVKASLNEDINSPIDNYGNNEFRIPMKLMFYGYDRHFAKKIEVVNLLVNVKLEPEPRYDWVISKISVIVNDDRKQNQSPA